MDGSDPKSRVAIKCRILIWVAGCSFKLHPIFFCFWFTPCFILLFDFAGAWAQVPYSNCICPLISLSRLMVILPSGLALSLIRATEWATSGVTPETIFLLWLLLWGEQPGMKQKCSDLTSQPLAPGVWVSESKNKG